MPVFFQGTKRVLFVHVPKAGGTAVEGFFERNGFATFYLDRGGSPDSLNAVRRCSPQHMCASQLQALFVVSRFTYAFMTVRHPIRRLMSKFVMETQERRDAARLEAWIAEDFVRVLHDPEAMDNHLRPQSDFLLPEAEVFRLEDGLDERFTGALASRIGCTFAHPVFGREMSAPPGAPDFAQVHPALRRIVTTYYAVDFVQFGYAPPRHD